MTHRTRGSALGAWLTIVGVFAAGALGGAATVSLLDRDAAEAVTGERTRPRTPPQFGRTRGEFGNPNWFVRSLDEHIDLTDAQENEIRAILNRHQEQSKAIFDGIQDELRTILEDARTDIAELLTEEQRVGMQEYFEQARERHRKSRDRDGDRRRRRPRP